MSSGEELVTTGEPAEEHALPANPGGLRRVRMLAFSLINVLGVNPNVRTVFWAMLFNEASFGLYQTLLPLYIKSLGASPGVVGLVLGISGIARLFFLAPGGWAAEKFDTRRLIISGRSLMVLGILMYGLVPTWWLLFPIIVIQAAANIVWPAVSKVIADSTTSRNRTRVFTMVYTVGPSIALLLTPSLGGVMADIINLRSIFILAAITQALSVFFFWRLKPIEQSTETDQPSVGYAAVIRFRPVVIVCSLFLGVLLVLTTGYTLVPNYLDEVHHLGIGTIGQFGSVVAFGSIVLGIIIAKVKIFAPPLNALLLMTGLAPIALLLLLYGSGVWIFALAYLFRGGYFVSWGLIYAILGEVTPQQLRSRAFALAEVLGGLGFGLAPFLAGYLYTQSPRLPLIVALLAIPPILFAILLARRYIHALAPIEEPQAEATT